MVARRINIILSLGSDRKTIYQQNKGKKSFHMLKFIIQFSESFTNNLSPMLIRIVRMHFTEAGVEEFLEIFNAHREAIRNFPGCTHLQLLKDADEPFCYVTLSHWQSEANLEEYRKSALFSNVWGRVKSLFSARSLAFSVEESYSTQK
jgi:heme oxygenase (mycobilin-producing)